LGGLEHAGVVTDSFAGYIGILSGLEHAGVVTDSFAGYIGILSESVISCTGPLIQYMY
jgi:hypothetical protein